MGLFDTLDHIVSNPNRRRGWKVFDVVLLCSLWAAAGIAAYMSWRSPRTSWEPAMFILVTVALVATVRSWYDFPTPKTKDRS